MDRKRPNSSSPLQPRLIIHGGAGNIQRHHIPPKIYESYRTSLLSILEKTQCFLDSPHASALDIATRAVELLEDDPLYNAGRGAVFTRDGINEMEASVMVTRGHAKRTAGVMGLRHVRNPIVLAKEILLRGDNDLLGLEGDAIAQEGLDVPSAQGHTLLHGPTAEALARQYGLSLVSPEYFFTQKRWDEHIRSLSRARLGKGRVATYSSETYLPQGTCGAVAADGQGVICVATSTGGLTNKLTGRIGDTPTPGAGYWAEEWVDRLGTSSPGSSVYKTTLEITGALKGILADCLPTPFLYAPLNRDTITTRSMAVSGTGNGDSFLRTGAARSVAAMARYAPSRHAHRSPALLAQAANSSAAPATAGTARRARGKAG
ncbi:L-asparaginase precursor [Emericellopsis atlantica]|uniref:L-asparaginase n=1 Tax=Emericellopsis atlantica TaxID=2614577 RepID=A0A9P7ZR58_9HYPO|nr:L-asparaginase precursor [Emericellopsis atlantica]KAG9256793.1 L-asparaginase precursor [Emericellopsis atlantica]